VSFVNESEPSRRPRGAGFTVLVGPDDGIGRLLVVRGLLPAGDRGWVHAHDGDEVIRVLSGEIEFLVGGQRRRCRAGETAVIGPLVTHGSVVGDHDAEVEVVAEQRMGSFFPVLGSDGTRRLVEVHRADVPFDRDPPPGRPHTTPEQLAELIRKAAEPLT
jgi:quercetin dioxygenase-like cupin family protein